MRDPVKAARPGTPPPSFRLDLAPRERAQIESVVGPLPDELALPIRDGRGRTFQRLEFLGDSVLDVLFATHSLVEPQCPVCAAVGGDVGRLVTDHSLAGRAQEVGLGAWLEWDASPERLADLVEACIAAVWLSGGWEQAAAVASRLVHDLGDACVDAVLGRRAANPVDESRRAESHCGAALLELAAGWSCFREHPDADEGELSRLRAVTHQVARVAAFARRSHLQTSGPDSVVSDQVEAWLAESLLEQGADAALAHAAEVLA